MTERTPGPWIVRDGDIYESTPYADVALARMERFTRPTDERANANAEFIVRACNAHDALVEAAREAIAILEDVDVPTFLALGYDVAMRDLRAALADGQETS